MAGNINSHKKHRYRSYNEKRSPDTGLNLRPFIHLGVILKKTLLITLFASLGLTFAASSFAQLPAKMLPLAADVVVISATVDSVDAKKRIVVLKDANGNLAQMNVSKQVNDLDKVDQSVLGLEKFKAGDDVMVEFVDDTAIGFVTPKK